MNNIAIGIDPGRTCGVAIFDIDEGKFIELKGLEYWDTIIMLNREIKAREKGPNGKIKGIKLVIENSSLNKPVFPIPSEQSIFAEALQKRSKTILNRAVGMFGRRAQNVGMNKQMSQFLIEYCQRQGFAVKEVRPSRSKLNAEDFRKMTGWADRSNQHSRDAGMLIYL